MPDTTIDVSVDAASLRSRLDGVTRANREERLRREREGLTQAEIRDKLSQLDADANAPAARLTDANATDDSGRLRSRSVSTWKRLDPSAQRKPDGLAHCWVRIPWANPWFPATSMQVGSGDGTAWVSASIDAVLDVPSLGGVGANGIPGGTAWSFGHVNPAVIHLPVQGETSIVVLAQQSTKVVTTLIDDGGGGVIVTEYSDQTRDYLAFVASRSAVRQLSVPATLSGILNAMLPSYTFGSGPPPGTGEGATPVLQINAFASEIGGDGVRNLGARLFRDSGAEFPQVGFGMHNWANQRYASAAVYQVLADPLVALNAFDLAGDSYAASRPFFSPQPPPRRVIQQAREGESVANNPLVYAIPPEYPYSDLLYLMNVGADPATFTTPLTTGQSMNPYTLSPERDLRSGAYGSVRVAWDWGNPGYCKAQLAALGFSTGDLTP
jgi:hypothetical protein